MRKPHQRRNLRGSMSDLVESTNSRGSRNSANSGSSAPDRSHPNHSTTVDTVDGESQTQATKPALDDIGEDSADECFDDNEAERAHALRERLRRRHRRKNRVQVISLPVVPSVVSAEHESDEYHPSNEIARTYPRQCVTP